jgi:hypothetical protein
VEVLFLTTIAFDNDMEIAKDTKDNNSSNGGNSSEQGNAASNSGIEEN